MKHRVKADKRQEKGGGLEKSSPAVVDGEASGVHEDASIFETPLLASQDHSTKTVNPIPEHFFLVLRCGFVFQSKSTALKAGKRERWFSAAILRPPHVIISAASSDQDCDLA